MKHPIDATNDYAFAMLFAVEENKPLLIDFINNTLQLDQPVTDIFLENPFNNREFKGDKLNIVDALAKDKQGRVFQVEVQVLNTSHLNNRMLYNWSCLYSKQLTCLCPEKEHPCFFPEGATFKQVKLLLLFNKLKRRYIHVPHN